uniref:uncharacterized protein LOC120330182 n=1 Tax=Styela clava TaxID=7725 RepID=UPI001939FF56|nr:uncharacterized protein LOC120330182 [Styela clava]
MKLTGISILTFAACWICPIFGKNAEYYTDTSSGNLIGEKLHSAFNEVPIIKFTNIPYNAKNPNCGMLTSDADRRVDCSYLEVYVTENTADIQKPVLLVLGNIDLSKICLENNCQEVVFIKILSPFFSKEESSCTTPQSCDAKTEFLQNFEEALIWVQHNVQRFGGDKSLVTVAGFGREASLWASIANNVRKYQHLFQRTVVENGDANWISHQGLLTNAETGETKDYEIHPKSRDLLIGYNFKSVDGEHVTSIVDYVESLSNTGSRVTLFSLGTQSDDVSHMFENALFDLCIRFARDRVLEETVFPVVKLGSWKNGVHTLQFSADGLLWNTVTNNDLFAFPDELDIENFPEILTSLGPMRGRHLHRGSYEADAFYHIPFASPTKRFEYSEMVEPWTDMLDARYPVRYKDCPQHIIMDFGHEDCLNLHIFVPQNLNETLKMAPIPVMIFMHGGSYALGSAGGFRIPLMFDNSLYDGTVMADIGKVVVVSVNYRLAALGFLNDGEIGNGVLDGNYGIRDVVLAMEWVQKYISEFGGDPNIVTIFGESAGSAGSAVLSISPMTEGLFHRVIQQSGSSVSFFAIDYNPGVLGKRVMTELGCRSDNFTASKECLMKRGEFDFIGLQSAVELHLYVPWRPTVDGVFLTDTAETLVNRTSNYEVMLGTNYDETFIMVVTIIPELITGRPIKLEDLTVVYEELNNLVAEYPDRQRYVSDIVFHNSVEWEMDWTTESVKKTMVRASSDFVFAAPSIRQAQLRAQHVGGPSTYMYDFHIKAKFTLIPEWQTNFHAQELPYVFGEPLRRTINDRIWNSTADELSLQMITYWTNFAKSGDPNSPVSDAINGIRWDPYTNNGKEYMELNFHMNPNNSKADYKPYEMELWNDLVPTLLQQDRDSCTSKEVMTKRIKSNKFSTKPRSTNKDLTSDAAAVEHRTTNFAIENGTKCDLSEDYVRNTTYGCVRGVLKKYEAVDVETYLGIPYATAPIGDLRFAVPEKASGWGDNVFSADTFGPDCPRSQDLEGQEEDCLYLNIYRPNNNEILPVMVWIHSDMVSGNGGANYDGKRISAIGNVIVVTFNYRIGALGFLYSGDGEAAGNFGLLDQNMALEWLQENIEFFGGDKTSITLFGDDDSSKMVGYQSVNVLNDGSMFSRVIHQSGVGQMSTDLPFGDDNTAAAELATKFPCPIDPGMVPCLKSLPLSVFMVEAENYPASVVVDGYFLTDQPRTLFEREGYSPEKYDYLISFTSVEGTSHYDYVMNNVTDRTSFSDFIDTQIMSDAKYTNPSRVKSVIEYEYVDVYDEPGTLENRFKNAALNVAGDKDVIAPSVLLANTTVTAQATLLRPRNRTFLCHLVSKIDDTYPNLNGAHRGTIERIIWANFNSTEYSSEKLLADRMIQYWTSFARNGKPQTDIDGDVFNNYNILDGEYTELDATAEIVIQKKYFRPKYTSLWNFLIPRIDVSFQCEGHQAPITPTVTTDTGVMIHGYADSTSDNRNYDVFRGLAYAEPPIGDLRFSKTNFVGEISSPDSTVYANIRKQRCLQTVNGAGGGFAGEDCLYLDIWRPSNNDADSKPVMLWICHGGHDVLGPHSQLEDDHSCDIDGRLMALDGDFIFVRVQYRIGVLGFLSTGDNILSGNAGLHDLTNALKWVYKNIGYFGGSKDKVTVAGDGFGGVLAYILAGMSRDIMEGTVQSVIAQSASLTAPWAYSINPKDELMEVAVRAGCQNAVLQSTIGCLRNVDPLVLITAAGNVPMQFPFGIYADNEGIAPSEDSILNMKIEGYVVKDIRQKVATMPTLIGFNGGAGYRFTLEAYPEIQLIYGRRPIRPSLITKVVENDIFAENIGVKRSQDDNTILTDFYIPWGQTDIRNEIRRNVVNYHTDAGFIVPVYGEIFSRLLLSNAEPVFLYVYEDRTYHTRARLWQTAGADLGEELPVVFEEYIDSVRAPLGSAMRHRWTNFVNRGSPNLPTTPQSERWLRYDEESRRTMIFKDNAERIVGGYGDQAFKVWQQVMQATPIIPDSTISHDATVSCPRCPTPPTVTCSTQKTPTCSAVPILGSGLGMELSPTEADVAIEVLFSIALSLAIIQVGIIVYVLYIKSKKKNKQTDSLQFSNKSTEKPIENGNSKEFSAL